jgi:hypothetical protein
MKKEYEITLAKFLSECLTYYDVTNDIAIEDVRFIKFTELLDISGIFKNPQHCRFEGIAMKNSKWSLLGYSFTNDKISDTEDDEIDNNQSDNKEYEWSFTFYNGFFSGDKLITNSKKNDILKATNETIKFIEATLSGNSKFLVQDHHPIRELQDHLIKIDRKGLLDRISVCIITDNLIDNESLETTINIESIQRECKIHYWGINKWADLARSKSKRLPIDIDFLNSKMKYNIPYLELKKNDSVKFYLSIFPGDLVADLYNEYDTQLLENNVRVFLSLKNKYNRPMSQTIGDDPGMFLSYNNGISATASSINVNEISNQIESIKDLQIVNGGQTTATLYHTRKHLKKSLSEIYISVKITVLGKTDNYANLIRNISHYANSQTAIKQDDFWTNDPYLIEFEKLSLRNPAQIDGIFVNYFFERMTGQYNETKNRKGTKRDILAWEKQNPKKLAYNKITLARWLNAMNLSPYISASSAVGQFVSFMKNETKPTLTIAKYKTIVGFGQLCERSRKVTGKAASKEFPPIISDPNVGLATSIYAMSYLQYISQGRIDYHKIFDHRQKINEFDVILKSIITNCWDKILEFDRIYTRDKTKTEACWKFVRDSVKLPKHILEEIENYTITIDEYNKRESMDLSEEEYYFTTLNTLLENNGMVIYSMLDIASTNDMYYKERQLINRLIDRINQKNAVIALSNLKELDNLLNSLFEYKLTSTARFQKHISANILDIYCIIFKSRIAFFDSLDNLISHKNGIEFEFQKSLISELKDLVEEFDLYPGLSIEKLERIDSILNIFQFKKV